MMQQTPVSRSHSESESAERKQINEGHFMNITHVKRWAQFALLIASLAAIGAQAQLTTASLSGSVVDPSGAVIPHAKITLTQTDTNFIRIATSKDDGSFHEEFLPVGPYRVSVVAQASRRLSGAASSSPSCRMRR